MFYESYEQKILKIAKIKDFFHRFRLLFLSIITVFVLVISGYLATKGMITKEITVSQEYKYGEKIVCDAEALFTKIETYEFKHVDSDVWTTTQPTQIGEYEVRAVVKKSFGRNGYSEPATFEVLPQPLKITIDGNSVKYGEQPIYSVVGLVEGDKFEEIIFNFEDVKLVNTKVSLGTVKVINANGDDVTKAYAITCDVKNLDITATDLEIKLNEITKVYDGKQFIYDNEYEIVSGQLYFGDQLEILTKYSTDSNELINVGTYENEVVSLSLFNNNIDVTEKYNVTSKKANIIITKRPITIKTPSVSKVYDGKHLCIDTPDECLVTEGSLVEGHELVYVSSPSIQHVGLVDNAMVLKVVDENGNDVTTNYDITYDYGTLEVLQKEIIITLNDVEKYFDNEIYSQETSFTLSEELCDGDSIKVIAEASGAKDAGSYELNVLSIDFTSDTGNASDYNFISESSTLIIKRRPVKISPLNYSITYGEYYKQNSYLNEFVVVDDLGVPTYANSLIDGSNVTINVRFEDENNKIFDPAKEIIDAGTYNIVITSHNEELNKNYIVEYANSSFTVNKRDVLLTAATLPSKEYDAKVFEYPTNEFELLDWETLEVLEGFTGEINVEFLQNDIPVEPINAGRYQIRVVSYSDNFNKNYNVNTYKLIDFEIIPCKITVSYINPEQSKIYDGEVFDDYDLSFNLKSANHSFNAPILFNQDSADLQGIYIEYQAKSQDSVFIPVVEAIDAGNYIVRYTNVLVTNEFGEDVSSNYEFVCEKELELIINRRRIEITPNSDEITYIGEIYEYDKYSFDVKDLDGELDIKSLLADLNAYINVDFGLIDDNTGTISGYGAAMYVGTYEIIVSGYVPTLDNNYEVSTGKGTLIINPCEVEIGLTYSEKVYDGTNSNTFDTTYTLTTENGTVLNAPYLYNMESIGNISFYLGTEPNVESLDVINVGTYYLNVDLDSIKLKNNSGDYAELVQKSYVFKCNPVEVAIIPRHVTIVANMNPSTVYYTGEVYNYDSSEFRVALDNFEDPLDSSKLIDGSKLNILVEFYDSTIDGNLIEPNKVKNAGTYYIDIVSVEFVKEENADNYIISVGQRTKFIIKPAEVDLRLKNMNDVVFDGAVVDEPFNFEVHRTVRYEDGGVGGTTGLIGGDQVSIQNAMKFYDNDTLEESSGINVGKYTAYIDLEKIIFTPGDDSDSVITNYKFTNTQQTKFKITERSIRISGIAQEDYEYCGDPYIQYNPYDYVVEDMEDIKMDYDSLLAILNEYGVMITPNYVLSNGSSTYAPVNVGKYSINVTANAFDSLFEQNFDISYGTKDDPTLTITQKYIKFMPVAQVFAYEDKPFEYPQEQYELIDGTYLCKDYHCPSLEVYYMKDGVILDTPPVDIYEFYEIYIKSVKIYENGEDISSNYDIDWYKGNDVYLNIFSALVEVQLNPQENVYYGEDYAFDPFDITTVGGLEGSEFKANIHYVNFDGSELPEEEKYHPTNAGLYKIVIDSVVVLGKYPAHAYNIQILEGNEVFEIMRRKATIMPAINENLVYDFDNALPYTYRLVDATEINKEQNNGLLKSDIPNITFDLLINGGMTSEFTSHGEYMLNIDESSITGIENYEISYQTNFVTVNKLDITVKLINKEKVYDGTALEFIDEYEIYYTKQPNIDITDKLSVEIFVTYNKLPEAINAGVYSVKVVELNILNYDFNNFNPTYIGAIYDIGKLPINISYKYPEQVFDYNGAEINFDGSFIVDPATPLVSGEEISLITKFKYSSGENLPSLPIHAGDYEGYYYGYNGPNNTQNYAVTVTNSVNIKVRQLEIVLNLLDKTHYFDGATYIYPTIFDSYVDIVYSVDGYVVPGERFAFNLIYFNELGETAKPMYSGTYEMTIDEESIVIYEGNKPSSYKDYSITIGDNAILTIKNNNIWSDTYVNYGMNTYEYDATDKYNVSTTFNNEYNLSYDIRIEPIYGYYTSANEPLESKPINFGSYIVKVSDCNVYINGKLDLKAKESITFDLTQTVNYDITKRKAYLYVQSVEKPYDGKIFTEEIPVVEERFIKGHEFTYDVTYLDAPYYECIDVREGGYRISIDNLVFADSSLKDNYDIQITDGYINITPRVLYINPTLTFDEFYTGNDINYTGDEWIYYGNDKEHEVVGDDSFKVILSFFGTRNTDFGYEENTFDYANEAYNYTISIVDIDMIVGKRTNYDFKPNLTSTGIIKPREIAVRTGSYETYYTGDDISYAVVELLEGYSLIPGHEFTYLGYQPTIIYGTEGIKIKDNYVPFGVVDEYGKNVSPNYYVNKEKMILGTIRTIERPLTITTGTKEFQYTGTAQSFTQYDSNKDEILKDGFTALIEGHEISRTSKRTKVTDITPEPVDNVLGFVIEDEDGRDVTDCYDIQMIYGKLSVIPYEIHVSLEDQTLIFNGNIFDPTSFIVSKNSEGEVLKTLPVEGDTFSFSTSVKKVETEQVDEYPDIGTFPAIPDVGDVSLQRDLLYVGNYVVSITGLTVYNAKGQDVTSNYKIVYDTKETFNVEIEKATIHYYSNSYSKVWDGEIASEPYGYYDEWDKINIRLETTDYTTLLPYDEATGEPIYFAEAQNVHKIRVYDNIYGADITESCLNINYNYGMLEFTDTVYIDYHYWKEFDNVKFEFKEDEYGYYLDELNLYGKYAGINNIKLKVYVTDILDEYGNSVTEILNVDNYTFIIDGSKTRVISNGIDLTDMLYLEFRDFTYHIVPRPVIVRPMSIEYTYDGKDIDYDGLGIAEIMWGSLANGHEFYLETTINHETTVNSKMNKKQYAYITDLAVYETNEYGEKVLYEDWERNYTVCYYDYDAYTIVNKDIIPYDIDPETGKNVYWYARADLYSTFKCNKIQLIISTPGNQDNPADYTGEYIKFDAKECMLLNPDVLLPNHTFALPKGYWLSAKTYSNSKGFINTIGADYWGVFVGGDLNSPVTAFYELVQNKTTCGSIIINDMYIIIQSATVEKTYDGNPLTNYGKELSEADFYLAPGFKLADGDYINYEKSSVSKKTSITYVGEIENKFTVKIYNKYGQDVTGAYTIIPEWGKLVVKPNSN